MVQVPGLTSFREFQPRSAPSSLSPTPSPSSSDAPLVSGFDISLLPPLQLTCLSVSKMCSSFTYPLRGFCSPWSLVIALGLFYGFSMPSSSSTALMSIYPMLFPMLVFVSLGDWYLLSLSGLAFLKTWALRSCLRCQRSKVSTHFHSLVQVIPVPTRRFSHVHIDIVGILPSSQGYSYLLTMIDRMSCWPEVALLTSFSAESCVRAFLSTWFSRFGVLAILTSDKGA